MSKVDVLDGLFPKEKLCELQRFFEKNVPWVFGSLSDREGLSFGHWNHDFLQTNPRNQENYEAHLEETPHLDLIYSVWKVLKANLLPGHKLVRCYANAHTYGVEGYPHVDSRTPGNHTTIIYLNPEWHTEWAGETVFINELGDIKYAILPKPGRVVTFDGMITHAARSLSRRCPALRVSLMFKTTIDVVVPKPPSELQDFLMQNGAANAEHSGYQLIDHLNGVYRILKGWNASEHVCLGGLFHSIYGTDAFRIVSVDQSRRCEIQKLIGIAAEELVYEFAHLSRPKLFELECEENSGKWAEHLRSPKFSSSNTHEKAVFFDELMLIECANLIEQKQLHRFTQIGRYAQEKRLIDKDGFLVECVPGG